jgi:hypothetical protein
VLQSSGDESNARPGSTGQALETVATSTTSPRSAAVRLLPTLPAASNRHEPQAVCLAHPFQPVSRRVSPPLA